MEFITENDSQNFKPERKIRQAKHGPEYRIQESLRIFLSERGWLVERMTGNVYQKGIPDLYLYHPRWGERWVDVKNPKSYSFTREQKVKWPRWERYKCGIWILTAATEEEYAKLFSPPNFRNYWKASWDKVLDVDALLDEIDAEILSAR